MENFTLCCINTFMVLERERVAKRVGKDNLHTHFRQPNRAKRVL